MPQKDNTTTILLFAMLGIGGYFYMKNKNNNPGGPVRRGSIYVGPTEVTDADGNMTGYQEQIDATIDTGKTGQTLPAAIETAKGIADNLADAKIIIKHQGKGYAIRKGKKKTKRKHYKLRGKKLKQANDIFQNKEKPFNIDF